MHLYAKLNPLNFACNLGLQQVVSEGDRVLLFSIINDNESCFSFWSVS